MNENYTFKELNDILEKENYTALTGEELEKALTKQSQITKGINFDVNFDDFESYAIYYRGDSVTNNIFSTQEPAWRHVVLLVKFRDESYFLEKFNGNLTKLESLQFTPGKTYSYIFDNVPKTGLKVLFPNASICMNQKDKLLFGIPAVGAGFPIISKLLTQLPVIGIIIVAFITGHTIKNSFALQPIIATLALFICLLLFVFSRYITFKNKKITALQNLSCLLFFKDHNSIEHLELNVDRKGLSFLFISCFVSIPILIKLYAQLPIIWLAITSLTTGQAMKEVTMLPAILFNLIILIILGCIIFKIYCSLKNKKIKGLKNYIDFFFFKNPETEPSALNSLITSKD